MTLIDRESYVVIRACWYNMVKRCNNPDSHRFYDYGGRGISVCDEWLDKEIFIRWSIENGWRRGLTLDRIDNDGNYTPENCRWTTHKQNSRNVRRNLQTMFRGRVILNSEIADTLCRETSIKRVTILARLRDGWPEDRLTEPTIYRGQNDYFER